MTWSPTRPKYITCVRCLLTAGLRLVLYPWGVSGTGMTWVGQDGLAPKDNRQRTRYRVCWDLFSGCGTNLSPWGLQGADLHVVREVMVSVGLPGSTPQCDCRNGGVCQRQLQMMPERMNVFSASGLSFVTPGHSLTYYCICSMGYAGTSSIYFL